MASGEPERAGETHISVSQSCRGKVFNAEGADDAEEKSGEWQVASGEPLKLSQLPPLVLSPIAELEVRTDSSDTSCR